MKTTWHLEPLIVTEINKDVRMSEFTPDDLLGENVPSVPFPFLASFKKLVS